MMSFFIRNVLRPVVLIVVFAVGCDFGPEEELKHVKINSVEIKAGSKSARLSWKIGQNRDSALSDYILPEKLTVYLSVGSADDFFEIKSIANPDLTGDTEFTGLSNGQYYFFKIKIEDTLDYTDRSGIVFCVPAETTSQPQINPMEAENFLCWTVNETGWLSLQTDNSEISTIVKHSAQNAETILDSVLALESIQYNNILDIYTAKYQKLGDNSFIQTVFAGYGLKYDYPLPEIWESHGALIMNNEQVVVSRKMNENTGLYIIWPESLQEEWLEVGLSSPRLSGSRYSNRLAVLGSANGEYQIQIFDYQKNLVTATSLPLAVQETNNIIFLKNDRELAFITEWTGSAQIWTYDLQENRFSQKSGFIGQGMNVFEILDSSPENNKLAVRAAAENSETTALYTFAWGN